MTENTYEKDLNNLGLLVNYAAYIQVNGSYNQRHPDLGRMFRCLACGKRRRLGGPLCCSAKWATTQRAWDEEKGFHQVECPVREVSTLVPNSIKRKFLHKKHGQSKEWKYRAQTIRFQEDAELLKSAVIEMSGWTPEKSDHPLKMPDMAAIPAFTEKYMDWVYKKRAKSLRKHSKLSRRINR